MPRCLPNRQLHSFLCIHAHMHPSLRLRFEAAKLDRPGKGGSYLRKIHTKRIHIHPVQERREALVEPAQALVHQLQVHEVGFQVRHRVAQFCEPGLQRFEREGGCGGGGMAAGRDGLAALAEGSAGRGAEGGGWSGGGLLGARRGGGGGGGAFGGVGHCWGRCRVGGWMGEGGGEDLEREINGSLSY